MKDECYHSKHGAIQEAQHVFIKNGLSLFQNKQISIQLVLVQTECIYYFWKEKMNQSIDYGWKLIRFLGRSLNYVVEELNAVNHKVFDKMHQSNWGEKRI
jgi:hypothetical protein